MIVLVLTLREVIDYLVEVGQYRDDMTEEEIVSLFHTTCLTQGRLFKEGL
jgi:hypothetical protein